MAEQPTAADPVAAGPWTCPSCFKEGTPEVVQVKNPEPNPAPEARWIDSSVRRCPDCKHTFGGTLSDRLAYVDSIYGYKYFGDYELSEEQADAVWEARAIAHLTPQLLEALVLFRGRLRPYTSGTDEAIRKADAAIQKALGQASSAEGVAALQLREAK